MKKRNRFPRQLTMLPATLRLCAEVEQVGQTLVWQHAPLFAARQP